MTDILIVEDQKDLAKLLALFIQKEGYSTYIAHSAEDALLYLQQEEIRLMVLDIALPRMDGFTVCRKVRQNENLPILILSARVGKEDKLHGFELGADDYLEKPVDPDILLAKIHVLLQRAYGASDAETLLKAGDITIDTKARQVLCRDQVLELNVKEYELLLLLIRNRGKTLNKDYIFNEIWGVDSFSEPQTLTVHIKRLRDKIEENPKEPRYLKTIWGVGYRYEEL